MVRARLGEVADRSHEGRGGIGRLEVAGRQLGVRPYRRGGAFGKLLDDRYSHPARARRELEELPAKIEKLEAEQAELAETISSSAVYDQNRDQAIRIQSRLSELEQTLVAAYARWEELEAIKARP